MTQSNDCKPRSGWTYNLKQLTKLGPATRILEENETHSDTVLVAGTVVAEILTDGTGLVAGEASFKPAELPQKLRAWHASHALIRFCPRLHSKQLIYVPAAVTQVFSSDTTVVSLATCCCLGAECGLTNSRRIVHR